jgi:uncharacterized protein (TIRG00374 family)
VLDRDSRRSMAVALVLAAVLLYFAFRGVDWGELLQQLQSAHPQIVALAFVAYTCSYLCRGLRWSVLLRAGGWIPIPTAFWGTTVGYLGNSFLPGRAGEVIRSAMVSRASNLDVGFVLATALTERVLDAAALVVIGLAALAVSQELPQAMLDAVRVMAIVGAVGLAGLLLAPRFETFLHAILSRLPFVGTRRAKLLDLASRFLLGLRSIQDPGRALRFVGLTVVIWTLDASAITLVAKALDLPFELKLGFLMVAALGLSSAAPSTPGFVGVYQIVAVTVLAPFGIGQSQALAWVILLQGLTYVIVVVYGLPGLWRLSLNQPKAVEPAR